jgi:YbbR domain-containing protein
VVVFTEGQQRNVPVVANIVGVPAPGFELASVSVDPLLIPVEGDADALAALPRLDTEPVSINAATEGFTRAVAVSFPPGILPAGVEQVTVTVTLRQVTGSRIFNAGVGLRGARSDRTYDLSVDRVNVVIGGSAADLDQFVAERFQVEVDVATLEPGVHEVPIVADLPAGLSLLSASPPTVAVTVTAPEPSGSVDPSASAAP